MVFDAGINEDSQEIWEGSVMMDRQSFIVDGIELRYIPGTGDSYAASSCGKIYSAKRKIWMKLFSPDRYQQVNISISGKKKSGLVHRLVALAWIPNPLSMPQVNHINAIRTDNRVENLEWSDAKLQKAHAISLGLIKTTQALRDAGRRNGKSRRKLTYEQAGEIRSSNLSLSKIASMYGVSKRCVHFIKQGETYVER